MRFELGDRGRQWLTEGSLIREKVFWRNRKAGGEGSCDRTWKLLMC